MNSQISILVESKSLWKWKATVPSLGYSLNDTRTRRGDFWVSSLMIRGSVRNVCTIPKTNTNAMKKIADRGDYDAEAVIITWEPVLLLT